MFNSSSLPPVSLLAYSAAMIRECRPPPHVASTTNMTASPSYWTVDTEEEREAMASSAAVTAAGRLETVLHLP